VPAIAALAKFKVVVEEFVLIPTVGTLAKLFKVNVFVEDTLLMVSTSVALAKLRVVAPKAVRLMFSTLVDVNVEVTAFSVAVRVSEPPPPVSTSPLLKLFDVDPSKVSAELPPVKVLMPVVKVYVADVLVVAAM